MAGSKRSWEGNLVQSLKATDMAFEDSSVDADTSTILSIFTTFRSELDEHHDRRERVIKASRDITALSKKMYAILYGIDCDTSVAWELTNRIDPQNIFLAPGSCSQPSPSQEHCEGKP